ncbi:MAG: RtcB family protein [Calditrichaeota bacterium]|nr:RtcB family protein [Calditrichota bacterium]MBT7788720.1 RtcB family protein [Calditrichota bacterium]
MANTIHKLEQVGEFHWRVPDGTVPGMNVPGIIFASPEMIPQIINDNTPTQVANVATLPGIIHASLAMPDIHWGYGFPIGGVAAFDLNDGVISPGGVGYDINCGVTLVRSDIEARSIRHRSDKLIDELFNNIPCGLGSEGKIKLSAKDFNSVLSSGSEWVVKQGFADQNDLEYMEENGVMKGGDPMLVSDKARKRAFKQLGTLGSGNHFIELQEVTEVFEPEIAEAFGLFKGQVVIMLHSGSRGFGHQICDDSLKVMQKVARDYSIELVDRQLACAPFKSDAGQKYFSQMKCAANFAWANRLVMVGLTREVFEQFFDSTWSELGMDVVYDVCHNIAKVEEYELDGSRKKLCIHRKGATRALGPNDPRVPEKYRAFGQPVLIPGDMGRASYVLVGTEISESASFNSTCHGAGRVMSRKAAIRMAKGKNIPRQLADAGIVVRSSGKTTLIEEVPEVYKDVTKVVEAVNGAGISRSVVRLEPIATIKG